MEAKSKAREKAISILKAFENQRVMEMTKEREQEQHRRGSTNSKKETKDETYRSDSFEADLGTGENFCKIIIFAKTRKEFVQHPVLIIFVFRH